jgi:hypothetical protein
VDELYETMELEGFDDLEDFGGDFEALGFDDWEAADEFGDWEFEETVAAAPVAKKATTKQAVTAAKVVAQAAGGPNAAKKVAKKLAKPEVRAKEFEAGEYESEGEFEAEFEALGGDWEILGEMAHYAEMAAEAETEAEADQFWGAIASLAGPLISSLLSEAAFEEYEFEGDWDHEDGYDYEGDPFLPAIAAAIPAIASFAKPLLKKAVPLISKGVKALGSFAMRKGRRFLRQAAKSAPRIIAKTGMSLAQQAAAGRPISASSIASTLGQQTFRHMANPWQAQMAARANRAHAGRFRGYGRRPRARRRPRMMDPRFGGMPMGPGYGGMPMGPRVGGYGYGRYQPPMPRGGYGYPRYRGYR